MPGGDRTGPLGMGAMTGRGTGYCAGSGAPGYANPVPGCGFGMGFGRGRGGRGFGFFGGGYGRRNIFHATGLTGWMRFGGAYVPNGYQAPDRNADPEIKKQALKQQADYLQKELDSIRGRLDEMDKQAG